MWLLLSVRSFTHQEKLIALDNELASKLAPAAAVTKTSLFNILLVYPFNLTKLDHAVRIKYNAVSKNMIELNSDNLDVFE